MREPVLVQFLDEINDLLEENKQLRRENAELKAGGNRKKLNDREVSEIRRLARTTGMTQRELADIYDINPATVSRIVRGIYHA